MYESHYGLNSKPFSIVPNPSIIFMSKTHQNALTYLEYGLREKAGFILLTGEIGAGKTTLVRHIINKIGSKFETAVIFNTNFSSDQLFRQILSEFEINCSTTDKEGYLNQLYDFLIDRYTMGRHALLVIDEAQNLNDETLEDIRMLSNLQTDEKVLLQIILVGQPELKERLRQPGFRQLAQRIAVNFHISPLDKEQTRRYIKYRMEKAGGTVDIFSRTAIDLIFERSGGIPRTINLICDTALVYGFADNLLRIDEPVIGKVIEDQICMAVGPENSAGNKAKGIVPKDDPEPAIMKRVRLLETSLKQLKSHYEKFIQKVNNDLLEKYQQLLLTEQRRHDQLMNKYIALLQTKQFRTEPDFYPQQPGDPIEMPPKAGSTTKFAHLMDIADAQEAFDKERLKIMELLKMKR